MRSPTGDTYKYAILGAGAAGLSLCYQLLEQGVQEPILVLDQKKAFPDDRTWCYWDVRPTPFDDLASRCWHTWDVFDDSGQAASQSSARVSYVCLRSRDFYARVLQKIQHSNNVTLRLDCPIKSCRSQTGQAVIAAGSETYAAEYAFDSRLRPVPPQSGISLTQHFFGQFVRTAQPCLDPTRCTLMDFRASQADGLHFFYLLPFSPTEALVETTFIQPPHLTFPAPDTHRAEIAAYLADRQGIASYEVVREEAGAIPMTTRRFPRRDGRIFFIGTAGGCTKASSGYTFARIQEQCRQIAGAAASGTLDGFTERLSPARFRFFDAVFLQAMADRPGAFPGYFRRLFQHVSPETLTAFLSETSTWAGELSIFRSLPVGPFLSAAAKTLRRGVWPPSSSAAG